MPTTNQITRRQLLRGRPKNMHTRQPHFVNPIFKFRSHHLKKLWHEQLRISPTTPSNRLQKLLENRRQPTKHTHPPTKHSTPIKKKTGTGQSRTTRPTRTTRQTRTSADTTGGRTGPTEYSFRLTHRDCNVRSHCCSVKPKANKQTNEPFFYSQRVRANYYIISL